MIHIKIKTVDTSEHLMDEEKVMNEKEKVNQITEGVIWKQLLLFFFPIVFGTFFSADL